MKKSKLLVVGLAAAAIGLAGAATGTVAWFTATQTVNRETTFNKGMKVVTSEMGEAIKLRLDATVDSTNLEKVEYTDAAGDVFVVTNNVVAAAQKAEGDVLFNTISLNPVFSYDGADLDPADTDDQAILAQIPSGTTFAFKAVPGDQARISITAPTKSTEAEQFDEIFASGKKAYNEGLAREVTDETPEQAAARYAAATSYLDITVTYNSPSSIVLSASTIYYSLSGSVKDEVAVPGSAAVGETGSPLSRGVVYLMAK